MSTSTIILQGTVKPDGTLELEGKVPLPPGKVSVTLTPAPYPERAAAFLEFLRGIRAIRERDGVQPDAAAAQAAARQVRDEFNEQVEDAGRLQDECRRLREEAERAGQVQVPVEALSLTPADHPFWKLLQGIWAARQQAGLQPRTVEAVEAERRRFRDEVDEEIAEAGRLQDECRRLREEAKSSQEAP